MPVEITMPQLSDTMNEGKILAWRKKEGDQVKRGEALAEVATDKADLEIESFHEGTLTKILSPVGTTVKVGDVIATLGEEGSIIHTSQLKSSKEDASLQQSPLSQQTVFQQTATSLPSSPMVKESLPSQERSSQEEVSPEAKRVKISPLAKNIATSYGVDYQHLKGSGEGGRIVKRDVESSLGEMKPSSLETMVSSEREHHTKPVRGEIVPLRGEALSKMRQTIASRMVESVTSIPHFYVTTKIHADSLVKLKNSFKPLVQYEGLTYNHLIIRAVGLALKVFPRIHASYQNELLVQSQEINIGIVTAIQDGLLIPVLKNADELSLADIVAEARALVQRARSGRPKPGDLVGGTFSISNMGMFPVESFTAIINPGQGAILAVSAIQEESVVREGKITIGQVMRVTLSVDHRIIDGIMAGEFLGELKRLLEDPVLLLA